MTRDDRFIGHLEDYLDSFDGDTPLPGHVRDAISAELPRTRQVRPRRGPARLLGIVTDAPSRAPWAIAAAAVVVAIAGGAWFLSGSRGDVGSTAPTPVPTVGPTTPPSAAPSGGLGLLTGARAAPCVDGGPLECVAAGTYALDVSVGDRQVVLDVPAGWWAWSELPALQGLLVMGQPDAPGSGWGVVFLPVSEVAKDPCDQAAGFHTADETDTVDELIAAMGEWPGFTVSAPGAVSVGDVDGSLVTVTSARTGDDCPQQVIWRGPGGAPVDAYPMVGPPGSGLAGRAGTFRIIEVDGELFAVRSTEFADTSPFEESQGVAADPQRHAADLDALRGIVESVRLEAP